MHFFFFNDPPPTEIYTLSLHDALPIWGGRNAHFTSMQNPDIARVFDEVADLLEIQDANPFRVRAYRNAARTRSEEHTSELQSHSDLVCRLLLEKKKKNKR